MTDNDDQGLVRRLRRWSRRPMLDTPTAVQQDVRAGLRSADREVRDLAVDLAGLVMDDHVARELLAVATTDGDPEQRAQAALALGPVLEECDVEGWDTPYSEPPLSEKAFSDVASGLRRLYYDGSAPVLVRRRALEAAVRCPQPWHEAALRAGYRSDDVDWRMSALFGMAFVPGFEDTVIEALDDERVEVRVEALRAAAERGLERAYGHAAGVARDESAHREERLASIDALAQLRGPASFEILERLETHPDPEIRAVAEEAMAELLMWESIEGNGSLSLIDDEDFRSAFEAYVFEGEEE